MKRKTLILILFSIFFSISSPVYATYQVSNTFPIVDKDIHTMAQDDNYLYIGGEFNLVGTQKKSYAVIYNKTTNSIEHFDQAPIGEVYAAVPDGSGGWYVGGIFDTVGHHAIKNLVHIKADKTINLSWTPNPNNTVYALYFDGTHVYVGGNFTQIGGQTMNRLAKVHKTTGLPDLSWNPNPNDTVYDILKEGSHVYVAGRFLSIGGNVGAGSFDLLVRLNDTNGNIDTSWTPLPGNTVFDIAISSTHVYAGGQFFNMNGTPRERAAKLSKTDGSLDMTWYPNASGEVRAIALNLSEGEIYLGGNFQTIGGNNVGNLAKVNDTNGNSVPSWTSTYLNDHTLQSVETILVSGSTVYTGGTFDNLGTIDGASYAIALNKSTAAKISSWNFNFSGTVYVMEEQGNEIFIGGQFVIADGIRRRGIARFSKTTNALDSVWNPNPNVANIKAIAVDDTAVYVGGPFASIGGQPKDWVAKLNKTNGNADPSWTHGLSDVYEINAVDLSSSHVYVGGSFDSPFNIAKLSKANGSLDPSWYPNPDATINSLLYHGGAIYTGGYFSSIGGQTRNRMAKLNDTNGNADPSWIANANNPVFAMYPSGSSLFTGGSFTSIGGQSRNYIAKLSQTNGNVDAAWNVNLDSNVLAIAGDSTHIYFGGNFTTVNGQTVPHLAKARQDNGAIDTTFSMEPNNDVRAIIVDSNNANNLYIGGFFTAMGTNNYVYHLSRIIYTPPTPTPIPNTGSSQQNASQTTTSKTTPPKAPVCLDKKPIGIPDLFQIDVKDTTAKLYFTPVSDSDYYFISFSENQNAERHGALAKLKRQGVQSYDVFFLKPNTTYYFKVRSHNGCMPGDWSSIMRIRTNRRNVKQPSSFYKYQSTNQRQSQNFIQRVFGRINNNSITQ